MTYTIWSRNELIGSTELAFRSVGFDRCVSGHFLPNPRGHEMMDELSMDTHCMRAYMHRDYRDSEGKSLIDPEYDGCDWFADVAEHLHRVASYELELRDEHGTVVPVLEIGIQDKCAGLFGYAGDKPDPTQLPAPSNLEYLRGSEWLTDSPLLRDKVRGNTPDAKDYEMLNELIERDAEQMEGGEYLVTPCDITRPIGWDYDETQGDNELGSGWNTTLRDIPDFPRYQVHVVLAGA